MKKLLIVIHSLSGGGAERVVSRLLCHYSEHHPDVSLSLALFKPDVAYEIPASVRVHYLGKRRASLLGKVFEQLPRFAALRRLIQQEQPDTVLTFMPAANLFSLAVKQTLPGCRSRMVVSERVALEANYRGMKKAVLYRLMKLLYRHADDVVCVAEGIRQELYALGVPMRSCRVVNNAVDATELASQARTRAPHAWAAEGHEPLLVSVGRLVPQKGHDVFIEALRRLAQKGLRPRALLYGTGESHQDLVQRIAQAGLGETVQLAGFAANPYPEVARASAFVFPSRWEGFPNALLEAMALGIPVIASDCPFGPRELLDDNRYGRLVPVDDPDALARAIEQLLLTLRSPAGPLEESRKARMGAARYTTEAVMKQWQAVLFPN